MLEISTQEVKNQAKLIKDKASEMEIICNVIYSLLSEMEPIIIKGDPEFSLEIKKYVDLYNNVKTNILDNYVNNAELMLKWASSSDESELKFLKGINKLNSDINRIDKMIENLDRHE